MLKLPAKLSRMVFLKRYWVVLVGIAYLVIALMLTSDLLAQRALAGKDHLGSLSYWVTWWVWHAFAKNYDLVYNYFTLYPIKTNLLPILSFPTSVFYYLLRPFLGSPLAFNALFPLYLALDAWIGFLFFRKQLKRGLAALAGGLILAFNPLTLALAERGEIALLGFWVLPLWMLLWDRLIERPTPRNLVWVVLGLYGVVIMSLQFWNLILTLLLLYGLLRAWKPLREDRRLGDLLLLGGLFFALLCLIYPASPFLWSTYGEVYAPLEVWQGAVTLSSIGWRLLAYGGLIGLLVAIIFPIQELTIRRWWLGIAVVNGLCYWQQGLAPLSLLFGAGGVPHHTNLTQNAPFLIPALLASGVLALPALEYGFGALADFFQISSVRSLQGSVLAGLAVFLVGVSGWLGKLPTSSVKDYAFYRSLAADPEDYVIIDFPLAADSLARRSVGEISTERGTYAGFFFPDQAGRTLAQVPIHHKKVVGGLTSSLYEADLAPYYDQPLIRLLAFEPISAQDTQTVIQLREQVIRQRIGYIVLHDPQGTIAPEFMTSIRGWLNWTGSYCLAGTEQDLEFWRARWHPAGCPSYTVQLGGADGLLATGEKPAGWMPPIFMEGALVRPAGGALVSQMTLWAAANRPYRLTLRGRAADGLTEQPVQLRANGQVIGDFVLTPQWAEYTFNLPRDAFQQGGQLVLVLHHDHATEGAARLTALYDWVRLELVE